MSLEVAKWTEIWLDSVSERAYQPAFVSAVANDGFLVLHNTRHSALELGKDVIARDSENELFAFQLKGNPGSRITISQWHSLYNQIVQLVSSPVPKHLTGNKHTPHTPVLVTNGEIDEDVQAAIALFNDQIVPTLPNARPLQTWTRGKLLKLITATASGAWPGSLESQILTLKAISTDGRSSLALKEAQEIATQCLNWDTKQPKTKTISQASAASTLFSIIESRYIESGNLFEAIRLQTIFLVYVQCYLEKYKFASDRKSINLTNALRADLFDRVEEFSLWATDKYQSKPLIYRSPFSEFAFYHARKILVSAVVGAHILESTAKGKTVADNVRSFISRPINYPFLDYEGLVPAFLTTYWAGSVLNLAATTQHSALMGVVHTIIRSQKSKDPNQNLPSPHYSLEDVIRWKFKLFLGRTFHPIDRDSSHRRSWFVLSLTLMLVRRNFKRTVKYFWTDVTRVLHFSSELKNVNEFPFYRADSATEHSSFFGLRQTWQNLTKLVGMETKPNLPECLKRDLILTTLLCVFVPHRCSPRTIAWMDKSYCPELWY